MEALNSLQSIYGPWRLRVAALFVGDERPPGQLTGLIDQFYNRLCQGVESGDYSILEPILDDWLAVFDKNDPGGGALHLVLRLNHIQGITYEVAAENLELQNAYSLIQSLSPIFLSACEYCARSTNEQNISENSQDLVKANKDLERLEKSKSRFIAIAAHELKTPLTLIEGYTSMLRDQLAGDSNFDQSNVMLLGIDNGARRLREIIDDMIDVSIIDNDLLALQFQPLWISRMLKDLRIEFAQTLEERRLILEITPFVGWDELIFGDTERLYQAFRNVFQNAVKYTPDGGRIWINGRLLPGFVEVAIQDSGIGIAPEDQKRIFGKFISLLDVSLHSSGKTKFKGGGPGLGLSITRGIIEAHGGSIWVESKGFDEVNCPGSTFHILLPIHKTPPDDHSARLFGALQELDSGDPVC